MSETTAKDNVNRNRFTNDLLSKEALHNVIQGNLGLLCQYVKGTVANQWACVILLLQFIEYLLKYQIQKDGNRFPTGRDGHNLEILYGMLKDHYQKRIETHFSRLMAHKRQVDPESFGTVEDFVKDYHNSYTIFRYRILQQEKFCTKVPYFYIVDTFLVLITLMECSNIDFDFSEAHSVLQERIALDKVLKASIIHS